MITDQDVQKLKMTFATKDDFKRFATKDDLKGFATKDDFKRFATKDDLKAFATKDDLKGFATKDDLKGFATKDDLSGFATKDDLNKNTERIIEAVGDMLSTKADKDDIEAYQRQLDNHEDRILALEVK